MHGLTPTYDLPVPAPAAPDLNAAALWAAAVPVPLKALTATSLSLPGECLPHLLGHLSAARADDDSNHASISVPAATGPPSHPAVFTGCMARVLARDAFLG